MSDTQPPVPTGKQARLTALAILGLNLIFTAFGIWLLIATKDIDIGERWGPRPFPIGFAIIFGFMGALIMARQPGNRVGWLFSWVGLLAGMQLFVENYAAFAILYRPGELPLGEFSAWVQSWIWLPGVMPAVGFLPLIFPDGRLPSPRWRVVFWTGIATTFLIVVLIAAQPGPLNNFPYLDNPYSFFPDGSDIRVSFAAVLQEYSLLLVIPLVFASITSLFIRMRSANSVQRQQIKWYAYAGVVLFIGTVAGFLAPFEQYGLGVVGPLLLIGSLNLIPMVIGVAILRYRLWDIDIVINRSLVYASVTAVLGAVFLVVFIGIQTLLKNSIGGDQALYPALLSGALVAGIFSPTRRRLRRFVDRRFYGIDLDYTDAVKQEEALRKAIEKEGPISTFGKYKALGLIGRGGMGEVYKSEDPDTGRAVAIKTLYVRGEGDREELVKRFHREAQAIEGLHHENIVKLYDYGEQEEIPYMVMEYIHGESLSQRIRADGGLPLDETVQILAGVASALDYAHGQGLVHRDIKPSNVIVEHSNGKPPRAVLMDFGIARMVSAMTALTGTGGMVGTLDYISPEQIQGAHQVDGRADIYSLGVMAYQMVTGELPFKHKNPGALIMAHLSAPPPDSRELVKDLPRAAAKAIQQAMAKDPEERFDTAGAFVRAMHG